MFPSMHVNPGRIIFEDENLQVCNCHAKAATKQILVPWVAFQCGCELEAHPGLQEHCLCGSLSSARPQWGTCESCHTHLERSLNYPAALMRNNC